ncbi:MAG: exodeoxyribonuclease VII small subunit [Bacteroidia bacterium]|nr:exodeoxyribonuclease VII small subunit [Bacteroidia bacterium]
MEEKFSLEDKLAEIRALVEKMQKGISDFDKQVELFKKGNILIEECRQYLNVAEMQIEKLMDES